METKVKRTREEAIEAFKDFMRRKSVRRRQELSWRCWVNKDSSTIKVSPLNLSYYDFSFVPSGAYALDITNREHKRSPLDPKFKQTLITIVEEFFEQNNDVMLYITETGDKKQSLSRSSFCQVV